MDPYVAGWPDWAALAASECQRLERDETHKLAVAEIRPGRFRRDPESPPYRARLCYTANLRRFVYNPALLERVFGSRDLQEQFLKVFGYQGSTRFTVYPKCWIRDLPLLDFGDGVYLGDGIVLGTNQVSTCQQFVTVDRIAVGSGTVMDQECMIGYGSAIGRDNVVGVRVLFGARATTGARCRFAPRATVGHHCRLGDDVSVGHDTFIGSFSVVESGVEIPDYSRIPQFSHISKSGATPRRRQPGAAKGAATDPPAGLPNFA